MCKCVCICVCPLCAHKTGDKNHGCRFGTLQSRYDYFQISPVSTEYSKPHSVHFLLPPSNILQAETVTLWLCSFPAE